jgi:hypothetical protein
MNQSFLGDGGILDPDGAMEQMQAWKGRIDKLAADTQAMSNALQDLRVTVADKTGLAEVTVDSAGLLVDLKLGRQVQKVAPEVSAQTIMATVRQARAQLADRSREIISETLGTESEAARGIAERVSQRLRIDEDGDGGEGGAPAADDEPGAHDWQRRRR